MTSIMPLPEKILGDLNREGCSWRMVLAELIDNSLDARATVITIHVTNESIVIADNGEGCEHPELMLQEGYSTKRGKPGVTGRYGIGLKHASFFMCKETGDTLIVTTCNGKTRTVCVNWGKLIINRTWDIPETIVVDALETDKGTRVEFSRGKRKFPSGQQFTPVVEELQFIFAPALTKGCRISFIVNGKKIQLEPPAQPEYIKSINRTITIGKKTAKLTAGIVANGVPNRRKGLSYFYAHRNIIPCTSKGCGSYPIANISGSVELGSTWKLGQNKSDVTDDDFEKLCKSVLREMEPLLQEAAKMSENVATERLKIALEDGINAVFGRAMRPGKTGKKGTIEPKGTDRKVTTAAVVGGVGRVMGRTFGGAGDFSIEVISDPEEYMCRVDLSGKRVTLNCDHSVIDEAASKSNLLALFSLVNAHIIHAV